MRLEGSVPFVTRTCTWLSYDGVTGLASTSFDKTLCSMNLQVHTLLRLRNAHQHKRVTRGDFSVLEAGQDLSISLYGALLFKLCAIKMVDETELKQPI